LAAAVVSGIRRVGWSPRGDGRRVVVACIVAEGAVAVGSRMRLDRGLKVKLVEG